MEKDFLKIIRLLEMFLGASKNGMDENGQIQFNCPECAAMHGVESDGKFNLEVNLYKGCVYQCWSCGETNGTKGTLYKLIKKYGSALILKEYQEIVKGIRLQTLYTLSSEYSGQTLAYISPIIDNEIKLPDGFTPINFKECNDKRVIDYLSKRGITQEIVDEFNMGYIPYTQDNWKLSNRIVIPSYGSDGFLNYWIARDFTNNKKRMKYMNPEINKMDIIFNEKNIIWDDDIVLVEGAFDMIASCPNTIPLLGKIIKRDTPLYNALVQKSKGKIIIFLDSDAKENVKSIYRYLNFGKIRERLFYVPYNGRNLDFDPSLIFQKYGKEGIIKMLNNIKQFNEIELLK